ncbi:Protein SGT1-like protein [Cladobotryum mycophilum]|uniref:Protein SGT1-like protein n=1 Tax=Cladobotryum mycophilum TaxID=491253 RepID=A0ABR0SNN7_9HYPO
MSHITLAQQGLAALETRDWDEAVTKLSTALRSSANPAWLIGRSKALTGLKRHQEALDDANLAWHKAWERNNRPLIAEAQYRRAVAYLALGQFANADACCIYAMRLIQGNPATEKEDPAKKFVDENGFWTATSEEAMATAREYGNEAVNSLQAMNMEDKPHIKEWRMASTVRIQALNSMKKLPEDDPARKLTTKSMPEAKGLAIVKSNKEISANETTADKGITAPPKPSNLPLRLQEYQTNTAMSVSIFSKGVNKEKLQEKEFEFEPWGEIDPEGSNYTVTPNKVELTLKKTVPGKWSQLKGDGTRKAAVATPAVKGDLSTSSDLPAEAVTTKLDSTASPGLPLRTTASVPPPSTTIEQPAPSSSTTTEPFAPSTSTTTTTTTTTSAAPAYPSSSRTGPKNWDKIGADENSDDEKDVNKFFKELYKNSTPEQQRAMMKSFTESNGTSLSTNWEDVKDRTVGTVPPDGVEAKKWEQ